MPFRRLIVLACLLFLASFFLYVKTHCASVYADDSGETATVAATLSIGHPSGYPLHTLLARLWSLIPLGDTIVLINLFSAFLAALCVALAALVMPGLPLSARVLAAALVGLGPVFWDNSGIAKGSIYMLNNALTLLCLWAALRRKDELFGLALGLALANHFMSQLVLFPCYLWLFSRPSGQQRRALKAALFLLPGISLYAFLFIRARQDPPINWQNIRNFSDFIFYVFRGQYAAGELSRGLLISARQLVQALRYLFLESWGLGLGLALFGTWLGFRRRRFEALALFIGWIMPLAAVTLYLNLTPERLNIMRPYLFPAYLCQALLAAWAVATFGKEKPGFSRALTACLCALLPAAAWVQAKTYDRSRYHFALDNARSMLELLPRNAVLFCAGDTHVFAFWYLQIIKQVRPDVAMVGTPVLPMDWVRSSLARKYPQLLQPRVLGPIGAESIGRLVQAFLEMNKGRLPLYFTDSKLEAGVTGWKTLPQGMIYAAFPQETPDPQAGSLRQKAEANLSFLCSRGFFEGHPEPRTTALFIHDFAVHHNSLGTWLEERGDFAGALSHYEEAGGIDPKAEDYPYNAGNALHQMGRFPEAVARYHLSLKINPGYVNSWHNLGITFQKMGMIREACQALQKVVELDPGRSDIYPHLVPCRNLQ